MSITHLAWHPAASDGTDRPDTEVTVYAWKFGGSRNVMVREHVASEGRWSDTVTLTMPDGYTSGMAMFLACQTFKAAQPTAGVFQSERPFRLPRRAEGFRVLRLDNAEVLTGDAL